MEHYKIKQITNSVGYNGKQYVLMLTTCGKLLEFIRDIKGKEEWKVIKTPVIVSNQVR